MQSTGHAGRHLSHPLQSSGMMITSTPWLKIAPNCGGQCRRPASQLMTSDISMRSGGLRHLGLRSCDSIRSMRPPVPMIRSVATGIAGKLRRPSREVGDRSGTIGEREVGVAGKQAFLSDEWFAAVGAAIAEHGAAASPPGPNVLMNLVITGSPFGDREFHMGSRDGNPLFGQNHLDGAD